MEDLFIYEPFNAIISGCTNCGKTHFILDMLETYYRHHFENIIIFCPTFEHNKTYDREWIFSERNVIVLDPRLVKKDLNKTLLASMETFKGSNTLFIIDDCANLKDSKRKASELCGLAFSGRHYGITTWVLVQKYNSIVKDFRENIRMLVLFFNKDEDSMKMALQENDIIPRQEREVILDFLRENKTAKLILRLEFPRKFGVYK